MESKKSRDLPPPYKKAFAKVRAWKDKTDGLYGFITYASCSGKMTIIGYIGIACMYLIALGILLPIADIFVGVRYLHDCSAQRRLPLYLIVMGTGSIATAALFSVLHIIALTKERLAGNINLPFSCIGYVITAFLCAWFIAGNVWLYGMEPCTNGAKNVTADALQPYGCFSSDPLYSGTVVYCDKMLRTFTYWETTVRWIIGSLTLISVLIMGGVLLCIYFCKPDNDDDSETRRIIEK